MDDKIVLLVDGSSYLYRAYHALPDLRAPDGAPTGAVHGFIAMMKWLRERYPAEHAVCVFDAKGPTFRDAWYPQYKANRAPMPEPLVQQIEPIHEVVRLLGWPVLEVPGIEADDAIGTLARVAADSGHRVIVSTGDKDLTQLVNERVTLMNTMARPPEVLDAAAVEAKFGVPPERIVDYLTLVGDSVDNVPGVDKVGPKTAARWLGEHGSLDAIVAAADRIKGAAGENLRRALDWLPTGRRLVTVRTDCDLGAQVPGWPALDALALRAVDRPALLDFYQRYGFRTWRRELEAGGVAASASPANANPGAAAPAPAGARARVLAHDYETVTSRERLQDWLARIDAAPLTALDTETDSLDAMRARIVGLSLATEPGRAAYVPIAHSYPGAPEQLSLDEVLAMLRPWLEDGSKPKLGQNVKYDLHVLANHGVAVRGLVHDTMLESYVLEAHRPHSLQSLAERHLERAGLSYEDLCGKGAHQIPFAQVDVARAAQYSGEDSEMALHVHEVLWPRLVAAPRLREVYERIEMPVALILQRMERHGVLIDAPLLAAQSRELAERMLALEHAAYEIAGQPFNLGSPKQIGEILFGRLQLP
ncbi:MAG TPA: 5'-3' exonuclease H3TH domain-containing protein, partial [Rubrivivax sp.]|nr:5'-3' exonuclease H3TH domain-containing protein [Rubrivivax sp.]